MMKAQAACNPLKLVIKVQHVHFDRKVLAIKSYSITMRNENSHAFIGCLVIALVTIISHSVLLKSDWFIKLE